MKYKIGDKVWIKDDLVLYRMYGGFNYQINNNEIDIRGKQVVITNIQTSSYVTLGYSGFNDEIIDHDKTLTQTQPQYEIY